MRRLWRLTVACVLLAAGLAVAPATPVAARDIKIITCSSDELIQALAEVQDDGGGSISFVCGPDPVTIQLESEQVIAPTAAPVVVDGDGLVMLSGGDRTRLFYIEENASLELRNIALAGGNGAGTESPGSGGAILNSGMLTITGSTLSGNSAEIGGAIHSTGMLTITESMLSGNSAGNGGAIFNDGGTLAITGSTLSGNAADIGGGAIYSLGGTVRLTGSTLNENEAFDGGAMVVDAELTITSSTLSGNQATDVGGALFSAGSATITSSTLIGNAASEGTGIFSFGADEVALFASIIAGGTSSASTCAGPGGFASQGYNLSDDISCNLTANGDQSNTDPQLQELGNYGGPTPTHRPEPGSPVIDRIPAAACATGEGGTTLPDQRGVPRPQSAACDIGSVEILAGNFCANRTTGEIRDRSTGGCGRREWEVWLEYDGPVSFCISRGTGEMRLASPRGCARTESTLVLPGDGPVTVCIHRATGQWRLAGSSGCTRYEVSQEIGEALTPGPSPNAGRGALGHVQSIGMRLFCLVPLSRVPSGWRPEARAVFPLFPNP